MRPITAIAVAATLVAAAGIAGPATSTDSSLNPAPATETVAEPSPAEQNLRIAFHRISEEIVDVRQDGVSAGDYGLTQDSIFSSGRKIGRSTQICSLLAVKPVSSLHCSVNLVLHTGQVTLEGSFKLSHPAARLAVTGGTGRYEGVSGQLTETGTRHDVNFATVHLIFP